MNTTDITTIQPARSDATRREALAKLRAAVDRTVGTIFYGTLLRTMRGSPLKGTVGHGGRGEEVFQNQLDQVLVERAGNARSYNLNHAIVTRFADAAIAASRARQSSHATQAEPNLAGRAGQSRQRHDS